MNISLTPELEAFVAQKIASGSYQTPSDIVRDGLRLLRACDEPPASGLDELRREVARGIEQADQGKVLPFGDQALERIRTRAANRP